jgi:hypothetical protein
VGVAGGEGEDVAGPEADQVEDEVATEEVIAGGALDLDAVGEGDDAGAREGVNRAGDEFVGEWGLGSGAGEEGNGE